MFSCHVFSSDFCKLVRCTLILHTPFLFILKFHFVEYLLVHYKSKFVIGAQLTLYSNFCIYVLCLLLFIFP